MMPGQLRNIRRNLITSVVVVNPGTTEGMQTLVLAYQYLWRGLPHRIGFILTSETPQDLEEEEEEGEEGIEMEVEGGGEVRKQFSVACVKIFKYLHNQSPMNGAQFFFRVSA
jgi:hypothetical protein